MRSDILYREELECLLDMVTEQIGRLGHGATENEKAALGHLWGKLRGMLAVAVSAAAP